jgi:hypothetical protein
MKWESKDPCDLLQSFQARLTFPAFEHGHEARIHRNLLREFTLRYVRESSRNTNGLRIVHCGWDSWK